MIIMGTVLNVTCNSDAELVKCFGINKSTGKRTAGIGDVVMVAVQKVSGSVEEAHGLLTVLLVKLSDKLNRDGKFVILHDFLHCSTAPAFTDISA